MLPILLTDPDSQQYHPGTGWQEHPQQEVGIYPQQIAANKNDEQQYQSGSGKKYVLRLYTFELNRFVHGAVDLIYRTCIRHRKNF